jgi:hypothetical protein
VCAKLAIYFATKSVSRKVREKNTSRTPNQESYHVFLTSYGVQNNERKMSYQPELLHYVYVTKLVPFVLVCEVLWSAWQFPRTCVVARRNSFSVRLFVEFTAFACKRLLGDLDHNVDVKLPVVHLYRQVTLLSRGNSKWLMFKWVRWRICNGFYSLWRFHLFRNKRM